MNDSAAPGLSGLLRCLAERVDQGAEQQYESMGVDYRPRFTPVMRALGAGAATVTQVTAHSRQTQGAISQTVKLMAQAGLVERYGLPDGRKSGLRLTDAGAELLQVLEPHWDSTFRAITTLEAEIGHPLLTVLQDAARALDRQGFAARLAAATEQGNEATHA